MTLKLYIAGPLFTPYHRAFHARNAARLRSEGFVCLVPHERSVARAFEWDTGTPTTPSFAGRSRETAVRWLTCLRSGTSFQARQCAEPQAGGRTPNGGSACSASEQNRSHKVRWNAAPLAVPQTPLPRCRFLAAPAPGWRHGSPGTEIFVLTELTVVFDGQKGDHECGG